MQLAYNGTNGQPYTSLRSILVGQKQLATEEVSMQSIRAWLESHPEEAESVMNQNKSYVFLALNQKDITPKGAIGITLTPGRSLAVDNRFIPYGVPLWLVTEVPSLSDQQNEPFQQLVIAEDTGGAIKGSIRGDVFWGEGEDATKRAGKMQSQGQYWILLPKT